MSGSSTGAATATTDERGGAGAQANAFERSLDQAQRTLRTTMEKGADLHALKQRPQ